MKKKWLELLCSLAVSLGTGGLAGSLVAGRMEQYESMYKPPLAPPGWVFPVVWTILYILMGIAAWLIYRSGSPEKKSALKWYLAQLAVNAVWSVLYFRAGAYWVAFFWLLLLWYLVFETIRKFARISREAAWLMIPYLAWITFAGYLNLAVALHG